MTRARCSPSSPAKARYGTSRRRAVHRVGRASAGAAVAKGRYLLFTDDDCLVPPGWVAAMLEARERHGVTALTGGFQPARMKTSAERYYEHRMRLLFADKAKPVSAAPMMNLLVERSAFEAVDGFSDLPLPAMEDWSSATASAVQATRCSTTPPYPSCTRTATTGATS